ncbi:winged helix-turn-helix domain-containing protein [Methanobacterium alcaliphilum]|uniref:winged helix-turn-helix domain-containing protein n=1 Tax=Methanobacterium alcaliphilum TaxID=392018 RepID=UPI00200B5820|nr:winged helix-turn-helix domain-containing protein [Methanobacterium alcaliphilum]MCK9151937.1 winged helix-turn-helix domain-containing protein [Methanobacterium alcaliphilum]
MENLDKVNNLEIYDAKAKLEAMHQDIKRLMERSNQRYFDLMLSNLRKDILNSISAYVKDGIENGLERSLADPCKMRKTCKKRFNEFLENNAELIKQEDVSKETLKNKRSELEEIRKSAPFDKCDICFSEVDSIFDKQVNLIHSLQIYGQDKEDKSEISSIPEKIMVKSVLEPISNKQRLQILKSMAFDTQTFTALSKLTGLRGGNLLFHIQKLLENDLIIQRHERGDYMITEKGYHLLIMLTNFKKFL